jgi:hypothetical protein
LRSASVDVACVVPERKDVYSQHGSHTAQHGPKMELTEGHDRRERTAQYDHKQPNVAARGAHPRKWSR